jgi:hypothetical protein
MRNLLLVPLFFTLVIAGTLESKQRPSIVGTWKLVSFENHRPDGTVGRPFGDKPAGYFFYDSAGHVEGSNRPDYTRANEVRPFRLEANKLIIEIREGGQVRRRELIRVN